MENYENKYKEALERAMKLQETCDSQAVVGWCEYIFPELKESEDEKIRKAILNYFTKCWGNCKDDVCGIHVEDIISWLEKQGERETLCDKCRKEHPSHSCQDITALGRCHVEYEQKYKGNVETKFKVGDYIINDYCMGRVVEINNNANLYQLDTGQCIPFSSYSVHLWDITKDAEDGDVLFHSDSASNGIFIFKEISQCGTIQKVVCYCDYDSEDGFCLGEKHTCCWTNNKILHPATKEQRDLLFQKMREKGYEWDAKKKELKKSQRMISAEAKEALYGTCMDYEKRYKEALSKAKELI